MLNEKLEYKEYMDGIRPQKRAFQGDLEGIRRPLVIIARNALEEYLGDKNDYKALISDIKIILEDFCRNNGVSDKKIETFKNDTIFQVAAQSLRMSGMDTKRKISFDDIIAEALYLGELKEWCLCCKALGKTDIYWDGNQLDFSDYSSDNIKPQKKSRLDRFLKLIAVCLIGEYHSGQRENVIIGSDIANWLAKGSFEIGKNVSKFTRGNTTQKDVFFVRRNISGVNKIIPYQDFIKGYDFTICEIKKWEKKPGYDCYVDCGTGKYLQKREIIKKILD